MSTKAGPKLNREDSAEQQARDLLERMGIKDAQKFSSGDVVELANLIAQKRVRDNPAILHRPPNIVVDLDHVVEILRSLPMLRRYGGDTEALNEAREILEKIRAAL